VINKVRMGKRSDFRALISKDASLLTRAVDSGGNTLLLIASANGKRRIAKELLRQVLALRALLVQKCKY
jgi:ankyrin repeat protein